MEQAEISPVYVAGLRIPPSQEASMYLLMKIYMFLEESNAYMIKTKKRWENNFRPRGDLIAALINWHLENTPEDEFRRIVSENLTEIFDLLIDDGGYDWYNENTNTEAIEMLAEHDMINYEHLLSCIDLAAEKGKHQMYLRLVRYKDERFGDNPDRFKIKGESGTE